MTGYIAAFAFNEAFTLFHHFPLKFPGTRRASVFPVTVSLLKRPARAYDLGRTRRRRIEQKSHYRPGSRYLRARDRQLLEQLVLQTNRSPCNREFKFPLFLVSLPMSRHRGNSVEIAKVHLFSLFPVGKHFLTPWQSNKIHAYVLMRNVCNLFLVSKNLPHMVKKCRIIFSSSLIKNTVE